MLVVYLKIVNKLLKMFVNMFIKGGKKYEQLCGLLYWMIIGLFLSVRGRRVG